MEKIFKVLVFFCSVTIAAQTFNYERTWATHIGPVDSIIDRIFFDTQNNIYLEGIAYNFTNGNSSVPVSYYNQFVSPGLQNFTPGTTNNFSAKISSGATAILSYSYNPPVKKIYHREKNGNYYQREFYTSPVTVNSNVWLTSNVEPGNNQIILAKYNASDVLQWKTYIPAISEIKTDNAGNIYLSGSTLWQNLGDPGTAFPSFTLPNVAGNIVKSNVYVTKLNAQGEKIWSTYIPSQNYAGFDVNSENVFVITNDEINASDANLATAGTFQQTKVRGAITKLNAITGARTWGTYYGFSNGSTVDRLVASEDAVFVLGTTSTTYGNPGSYFATQGAFQAQINGNSDYFLAKFDQSGNRVWGTYYGTPTDEYFYGATGNLCLSGDKLLYAYLQSGTYNHSTPGAYLNTKPSNAPDITFTMFNTNGNRLVTSYYGGPPPPNNNISWAVRAEFSETEDAFYLFGTTNAQSGHTTPGALQQNIIFPNAGNAGISAFITKFSAKSLSTSETSLAGDLILFDNPNNGRFSLKGNVLKKENCSFKIYDMSGRFVAEEKLSNSEIQQFNYQTVLKTGNYVLSVLNSNNNMIKNFKMIVK
ncbi:T9SS type A sorting domain-containing protein [Chryseobacterium chendengshani]|uniref:T9SS type A sorting domain-containing protein n=1 Tax=unclassified Chryseobacterium TaxID=2593645 RepID=UPI001C644E0B|nr:MULTISPECIES: T9SS type A sorting domain-containing protein [unclassified Chryseobacterium]MBW7675184.1 T9SS type A sorting domain-containing protein [Chryseobacterium sp. LJ756]MBW8522266.1 T9SS type A sorting domain-containing protein [Chryseobacterium sp. LJ668]QYK17905.1 T9SS type A sorting domain-containing protein [Chryseobacterium sp. LJ668]